jgi:hypothetical protein
MRKTPQDLANYSNEIQQLIDNQFVDKAPIEVHEKKIQFFKEQPSANMDQA